MDHSKRDKSSHLLKHARESQHTHAWKKSTHSRMEKVNTPTYGKSQPTYGKMILKSSVVIVKVV